MREWLRWKIAALLDRLPGQCWTDLVWWALQRPGGGYGQRTPWSPQNKECWRGRDTVGVCYCGKLRTPEIEAELAAAVRRHPAGRAITEPEPKPVDEPATGPVNEPVVPERPVGEERRYCSACLTVHPRGQHEAGGPL
jgi:hypothetical protein